jgi:MFS family permease
MSIAASRSDHLGPRAVSVISAFGYGAMLSGPPVIGFVADVIGLPQALWLIVTILVISLIITPRAAQTGQASQVHS